MTDILEILLILLAIPVSFVLFWFAIGLLAVSTDNSVKSNDKLGNHALPKRIFLFIIGLVMVIFVLWLYSSNKASRNEYDFELETRPRR